MSAIFEIVGLPASIVQGNPFPCPIMVKFPTAALGEERDAVVEGHIAIVLNYRNVEQQTGLLFGETSFSNCRTDLLNGTTFLTFYDPEFQPCPQVMDEAEPGSYRLVVRIFYTPWSTAVATQIGHDFYSQPIRIDRLGAMPEQKGWSYSREEEAVGESRVLTY